MNTAIEDLVARVQSLADGNARAIALDLVQAVMDLHSSGLTRMMEVISGADPSGAVAEALAGDDLISSVLLLHDLHPLDLKTRVLRALEEPALHARGARVDLISVEDGMVRVRVEGGPALKIAVEKTLSNVAPDAANIVVDGGEGLAANFVPLEQLLAT